MLTGVRVNELPGMVDLTAEGTLDWAHWGVNGDVAAVNRKGDVPQQISNASPTTVGVIRGLDCCVDHFSWTDAARPRWRWT
jgi:hypothetical protein